MTIRCNSDQQVSAVAEIDTEKAGSVDVRSPGATHLCVAEGHADGIGIAELAILGPHSIAYSGNPKPSSGAVAGQVSVGRSWLGGHCRMNQARDIRLEVGILPERLRTLHRVYRARIESSIGRELDLLRRSWQCGDIPRPVLDVLLFGLAARSDLRRSVSEKFGGRLKAHTERRPSSILLREAFEWIKGKRIVKEERSTREGECRRVSSKLNSRGFHGFLSAVVGHRTVMRARTASLPYEDW